MTSIIESRRNCNWLTIAEWYCYLVFYNQYAGFHYLLYQQSWLLWFTLSMEKLHVQHTEDYHCTSTLSKMMNSYVHDPGFLGCHHLYYNPTSPHSTDFYETFSAHHSPTDIGIIYPVATLDGYKAKITSYTTSTQATVQLSKGNLDR